MNYISQLNAFWKKIEDSETQLLKTSSITTYGALLHKNNGWAWREYFTVEYEKMMVLTGVSKNTYYDCLKELVDKGFIKYQKSENRILLGRISIVPLYQSLGTELVNDIGNEQRTDRETTCDSISTLNKPLNSKTNKPIKRESCVFMTPTIDSVKLYFEELNSGLVEAEKFFDHYESNGWKVGPNKMKNWHATARGWLRKDADFKKINSASFPGKIVQINESPKKPTITELANNKRNQINSKI